MKSYTVHSAPTKVSDMNFEDFYDDTSRDWEYKARKLQARRWRMLSRASLRHPIKTRHG